MASDLTILALIRDLQKKIAAVEKAAGPSGPKGDKGEKGEKGDAGERGPQGLNGRDGLNGVDGRDGMDGLDGVGVVSVSEAADGEIVFTLTDGSEYSVALPDSLRGAYGGDTLINAFQNRPVVADTTDTGGNGSQNQINQNATNISTLQDEVQALEDQLATFNNDPITSVRTTAQQNQVLVSGQFTILDYDDVDFNTDATNFTVGANGRITVASAGIYSITAGVTVQASALSAVTETALGITVNGNLVAFDSNESTLDVSETRGHSVATTFQLAAGDIVDARAAVVSALGVGNILALILPILFGQSATQVNHLSLTRIA